MEIHAVIQAAVDAIPEGQFVVVTDEDYPELVEAVTQIRDPVWRLSASRGKAHRSADDRGAA